MWSIACIAKLKVMNSTIGFRPPQAAPTAIPAKPCSVIGVSMTRFESRPARTGQWEYYFYIDVQGHPDEPHVAAALQALRAQCDFFKLLGSYPLDTH